MIDLLATLLCVTGFATISLKHPKPGFLLSIAGSVCWFLFGLGIHSPALIVQSIAFMIFGTVGYMNTRSP